jgi:hypothetical protein
VRFLPAAAALVAAGWTVACAARGPREAPLSAEEENLLRRVRGLEAMQRELDANGRLLRFEHVLVVVRQKLIQQVLDAGLPVERRVADRYLVRVEAARVLLEDGFATVELDGRASLADGGGAAAEVRVHGGLDVVDLDPASGVLRARARVYAVEARKTELLGLDVPAQKLVEDLSREQLAAFEPLLSSIEIPVSLASDIELPALGPEGGVTIAAERIPVGATIHDVKSFHHRLWVSVRLSGIEEKSP